MLDDFHDFLTTPEALARLATWTNPRLAARNRVAQHLMPLQPVENFVNLQLRAGPRLAPAVSHAL